MHVIKVIGMTVDYHIYIWLVFCRSAAVLGNHCCFYRGFPRCFPYAGRVSLV